MAVDTDSDNKVDTLSLPAQIEVTAADVPVSAKLEKAYLYWGGTQVQPSESVPGSADDSITLTVPNGSASELAADTCYGSGGGALSYDIFICRADVTARVEAAGGTVPGNYEIDDYAGLVADGGTDNASAALVLIWSDKDLPENLVTIWDGLMTMSNNVELLNLTGFEAHGRGESLAWYSIEGDTAPGGSEAVGIEGLPSNTIVNISGPVNPSDNPMNHTINTVNPPATDTISLDVDRFDIALASGVTSAEVTYSADTDKWWLVVNVLSVGQPPPPLIFEDGFEVK